jgi:beta-mannosidase
VPGDIHQGLIADGQIKEPLLGMNSFDCTWTEKRSWWLRTKFTVDDAWLSADRVELEMAGLDANAVIFLNGDLVGKHASAFRPFVCDVKTYLRSGENILLVRLTAGVETFAEVDTDSCDGVVPSTEANNGRPERGDPRRIFVRKPQYSWGWDWSPRVATTAIGGDVTLRAMDTGCIRDVALDPGELGDTVLLTVTVTVDQFHYYKTRGGTVKVTITDAQGGMLHKKTPVLLRSGLNYITMEFELRDPRLWWPNGLGEQHLYQVDTELQVGESIDRSPSVKYGLRFVSLDTEDTFAFIINGKKVYARGANWIPADTLYARVDAERYDALVRQARDANFNMLRIWGGGLYEADAFYQACDRYGIMLWHDFMFACAPYPDHEAWFVYEAEKEAEYQTKRLCNHSSIVLWCGNNENHWGFADWWHEKTQGGARIYNYILPDIVRRNCPGVPYWNSSPYGGERPNAYDVGDCHYWHEAMMNPDMVKRITPEVYDACTARFVSEFGYIGAPSKATITKYLDGAPFDRQSQVWQHHNNTFEKNTVEAGLRKHYADPEGMRPDDYVLYSGLTQGLMYGYALDTLRAKVKCGGSLFWMFADCWGEIGWTIIDAYMRRKPSWYFVRRSYEPLRLILRTGIENTIAVTLANDTINDIRCALEVGYISFDGQTRDIHTHLITSETLTRTVVAKCIQRDHDPAKGLWLARAVGRNDIQPAVFRALDYREMDVPPCELQLAVATVGQNRYAARVGSSTYAHCVHFILPEDAVISDNYFDLLPGETRGVTISTSKVLTNEQIRVTCVNDIRNMY